MQWCHILSNQPSRLWAAPSQDPHGQLQLCLQRTDGSTHCRTSRRTWHASRTSGPGLECQPSVQGHFISCACAPTSRITTSQKQQVRLHGSCYEDIIAQLADRALAALHKLPADRKLIIGVAGAPGSGKSTLAAAVMQHINQQEGKDVAVLLPMDGFHYYKRELDQMPDPKAAYARRGAHWTFNAERFVACVRRVREQGHVLAPSFEHGVGDPVEDAIHVTSQHRVVLVEGNYVLLDLSPWGQLKQVLDDTWFVDVDLDTAMDRVFRRQTGNGLAPEVSQARISGNDRPNGETIIEGSRHHAAVLVPSSIPWAAQCA